MHYYPKNIGDYRRDTMNLSLLEHGVYTTLIDHYTLNEEPISLDHLDKILNCLLVASIFIHAETENGESLTPSPKLWSLVSAISILSLVPLNDRDILPNSTAGDGLS